jgi:hypothetical protein
VSSSWPALRAQLTARIARHDQYQYFQTIRSRQPDLQRFADIGALLGFQQSAGPDPGARNAVLRALVAEAQADTGSSPTAATVLLLALWPGLDAVHGRMIRCYRHDPDALVADLTGGLAVGIGNIDLGRVTQVAATLVMNLERDLKRALQKDHHIFIRPLEDCEVVGADRDLECRLQEHDLHRLLGPDAPLVAAVALHGATQAEAARMLGIEPEAARKRYQRALRRLEAFHAK